MIPNGIFERVIENIEDKQKGPYCIDLIINDSCSLKCLYCSGSIAHSGSNSLSKEVLIKLLDSAKRLSVQEISLTSLVGEPTIFRDIKFLLEEIKKRNFIGTLLTNGWGLSLEFAQFLHRINWDILIISLDSFDPNIQYKLRPSISGKEYLKDIIIFLEHTAKNNPQLNINFNMVVNNLNYADIQNYFKIAQYYGAKNITLLKLMKMTDYYEQLALTDRQIEDFKHQLRKISTKVNYNKLEWLLGEEGALNNNDNGGTECNAKECYFHLFKMLINCDGKILKCNGDSRETGFNIHDDDLQNIYGRLSDVYRSPISNPQCWDLCCSPIKALNQEIAYNLTLKGTKKKQ